jgi:hypothetical protein
VTKLSDKKMAIESKPKTELYRYALEIISDQLDNNLEDIMPRAKEI